MVLDHAAVGEADIVRVTQLINKTNQFNLATRRMSETELQTIVAQPEAMAIRLRLTDRFGDAGIIAVVTGHLVEAGCFAIDDWLMSCRVIGRDVEYATLLAVVERLRARGVTRLEARYIPSGRNGMVADLLDRLGFATESKSDGSVVGRVDLAGMVVRPSPVAIRGADP